MRADAADAPSDIMHMVERAAWARGYNDCWRHAEAAEYGSYECHITLNVPETDDARGLLEQMASVAGWKTSEIERDPLLGKKTYFYLTKHSTRKTDIAADMHKMVKALTHECVPIVRQKIESIIFDVRL